MRFKKEFRRFFSGYLQRYYSEFIIVEGKKDVAAMQILGFVKVYAIHEHAVPLRERARQIASLVSRHDRVCILTDFDRKGKQLHEIIRSEFQMLGVRIDGSLRNFVGKTGVSHIEGLDKFAEI